MEGYMSETLYRETSGGAGVVRSAGSMERRKGSQVEEDTVTAVISVSIKQHLTSATA